MELQEDLNKKSEFTKKLEVEKEDIFPKAGEKVSSDAKKFIERLKKVRFCKWSKMIKRHQGSFDPGRVG